MGPQPPSFASQDYWESRFQHNSSSFDWLLPASGLDEQITDALSNCNSSRPTILHIGCGTSLLSFHLRNHVQSPSQIHNLDFSAHAIEWGRMNENRTFGSEKGETQSPTSDEATHNSCGKDFKGKAEDQSMNWSQVSLLSLNSILSACPTPDYTLVVDKSCSDAIACGEDLEVTLPFPLRKASKDSNDLTISTIKRDVLPRSYSVHPINMLALHLALVTPPRARWVALSYSADRFSFITTPRSSEDSLPVELWSSGFPLPSDYWKLTRKSSIELNQASDKTSGELVHRPAISHWVYVLERTEMELKA
jgi:hypothetical protein